MRWLPTAALVAVSAVIVAGALVVSVALDVDAAQPTPLGEIQIVVVAGTSFGGFQAGNYGSVSGQFPTQLFNDGQPRDVAGIYQLDGQWYMQTNAAGWNLDLEPFLVEIRYENGKDTRGFHLGGFVEPASGATLRINPPAASWADWTERQGETITLAFSRAPVTRVQVDPGPRLADPVADENTLVSFIATTTPGGGVVAQGLIVIVTYLFFMWTPMPDGTWRIFGAVLVLVLSAWVPVVLGLGEPFAAALLLGNVALGAYCWKVWMARTEAA